MRFEGNKIWFDQREGVGNEERRLGNYDADHPEPIAAHEVFIRYRQRERELQMERQDSRRMHRPGHTHDYGIVRVVIEDFQKWHPEYFID